MEHKFLHQILKWIKKYILMRDLKEKSSTVLIACIKLSIIPIITAFGVLIMLFTADYAQDFNKLEQLDGVIKTNNQDQQYKHGQETAININVVSESKVVSYYLSPIKRSEPLFVDSAKIEGQYVRVWYLPDENKFYLIKFLQTNDLNNLKMAKTSRAELIQLSGYTTFWIPFILLLVLAIILIIQLLIIRLEIFRRYDLYFIDQRWDWRHPIKLTLTIRFFVVFGIFIFWPFVLILNCL